MRQVIDSPTAPKAIGPYSQAVRVGQQVWLSGQIPLDPRSGDLVGGDFSAQARQVFANLEAVAIAAGGTLADAVRLTIYLTDLTRFSEVNAVMAERLSPPYPARATVQVSALPRGAAVEIDAVLVLPD